jgi:hypothetical protein
VNKSQLIKAGEWQLVLRSINLLIVFGIRKNCLRTGRSPSMYLLIRRLIKQTLVRNYRGTSILSIMYKLLSNIVFSRLTPYAAEITGDHQCGFRCNRSTTDHIFCVYQILEKKWE